MDLKVLRFKFWKQISPTMNYFQDIGAIKKFKCIFLKKVIVNEIMHLTLITHMCMAVRIELKVMVRVTTVTKQTNALRPTRRWDTETLSRDVKHHL